MQESLGAWLLSKSGNFQKNLLSHMSRRVLRPTSNFTSKREAVMRGTVFPRPTKASIIKATININIKALLFLELSWSSGKWRGIWKGYWIYTHFFTEPWSKGRKGALPETNMVPENGWFFEYDCFLLKARRMFRCSKILVSGGVIHFLNHTLPKFNVNAGAQNLLNKHNTLDTVQLLGKFWNCH